MGSAVETKVPSVLRMPWSSTWLSLLDSFVPKTTAHSAATKRLRNATTARPRLLTLEAECRFFSMSWTISKISSWQ